VFLSIHIHFDYALHPPLPMSSALIIMRASVSDPEVEMLRDRDNVVIVPSALQARSDRSGDRCVVQNGLDFARQSNSRRRYWYRQLAAINRLDN
jgi:hypothetical protein